MSRLAGIEDDAALFGIVKQHGLNEHRRIEWKVTCRGKDCRTPPLLLHWGPMIPPHAMVKDVRKKGWLCDKHERPLCPACQKAISRKARDLDKPKPVMIPTWMNGRSLTTEDKRSAAEHIQKMAVPFIAPCVGLTEAQKRAALITIEEVAIPFMWEPEKIKEPTMTSPTPPVVKPSPNAAISRAVYGLLEEFLDEKARSYLKGYSDQRVADEVGCHISVVANIRAEGFCELVEDQRIGALREDIAAFERALTRIEKTARDDVAALRSRLEQIALSTKSK